MKLIQGDCLEVMKTLPDNSVDAVVTDPPYGITACKWDSIIPLEPMWTHLKRIVKPNGAIVLTASQPFTTTLISSNMAMFKYCWYWKKNYPTGISLSQYQPMRVIEDVVIFANGRTAFHKQMRDCADSVKARWKDGEIEGLPSQIKGSEEHAASGAKHAIRYKVNPINFFDFKCVPRSKGTLHPTQKPVALMEYLIKTYTNEGETVLDFCMGSGTTGVACVHTGRHFIGIELDEKYFDIAKRRIEETDPLFKAV